MKTSMGVRFLWWSALLCTALGLLAAWIVPWIWTPVPEGPWVPVWAQLIVLFFYAFAAAFALAALAALLVTLVPAARYPLLALLLMLGLSIVMSLVFEYGLGVSSGGFAAFVARIVVPTALFGLVLAIGARWRGKVERQEGAHANGSAERIGDRG